MSGPGRTYGPRFSGGYQFPRTHASRLSRGEPIRVERLGDGAFAQIVPLTGGRARCWDVCGEYTVRGPDGPVTVQSTSIEHDELAARAAFVALVRQIAQARARPSR